MGGAGRGSEPARRPLAGRRRCPGLSQRSQRDVDLPLDAFWQLLIRGSSGGGGAVNGLGGLSSAGSRTGLVALAADEEAGEAGGVELASAAGTAVGAKAVPSRRGVMSTPR